MSKKVLYIGDEDTYHLFDDVARRTESEIVPFYAVTKPAQEIINSALEDVYAMVILNVAEILSATEELSYIIKTIQSSVKTCFLIMAEGYSPKSSIIIEAAQNGVSYFMLTDVGAERNRIFVDALAGVKNVYDVLDRTKSEHAEEYENKQQAARNARANYNSISVAVASCMPRIGCTSTAIQLIKYLFYREKTACFLDFSGTGYTEKCAQYYNTDSEDYEHHRITLDGIDMYYDISAEIMSFIDLQNYDFLIYDMGNISDNPQKQTEFLQKKYRIIVTGNKPNENEALISMKNSIYKTKISYIYNFIPVADRESILEDVEATEGKCYFLPYMDEVFSLVKESVPLFNEIFLSELPVVPKEQAEEGKKKKKGFFKKRNKKGAENG